MVKVEDTSSSTGSDPPSKQAPSKVELTTHFPTGPGLKKKALVVVLSPPGSSGQRVRNEEKKKVLEKKVAFI